MLATVMTQRKQRYTISKARQRYTSGTIRSVYSVCFSPDGSMLATGDEANKTTIYDLKSKTKIHEWDHKDYVYSICFSPDGSMLATGDNANKTTIFMPQMAHPNDHHISCVKGSSLRNPWMLFRPCPDTQTTFLHRCVKEGDANLLKDISCGIVMKYDKDGNTPMDIAIQQKSHQKCLLLAKACVEKPNNYTHEALVHSIPTLMKVKYHDVIECIFSGIMIQTDTSELERFSLPKPLFEKALGYGAEKIFKGETKSNIVEVKTYRIILQSLFEKKILIDVLENASLKTFDTKAMRYIVTYLWQRLLLYYFLQSMVYLVAVFCFTFGHFCELFDAHTVWYSLYPYFLLASGVLIGIFVGFECRHLLRRGLKKHFKSGWNRYEVVTYAAALASVSTKLVYQLPNQEILDASALILLWIGIFNKIRGFEKFSRNFLC